MENEQLTAVAATAEVKKTDCGCGGTAAQTHDDKDDCPCHRRAKIKKMIVGGVILVLLGVTAYTAWRMGYMDKAMNFVKEKIKKIG